MKIAVLSDSHIGQRISVFPKKLLAEIFDYDAIIHCGDFTNIDALNIFKRSDVLFWGVCGNMDDAEIVAALPESRIIHIEGIAIGITHGWGSPYSLDERVFEKMAKNYPDEKFDVIFFGHSHIPSDTFIGGTKMLNPGSVSGNTDEKYGSFGIFTIENGKIVWEIEKILPKGY